MNKVLFSSEKMDWTTPQDFYDELDAESGFTLDPASSDDNHKCAKYFTKEQDGLKQSWSGETVFCNPPYGRDVGKWVKYAYEQHTAHGCTIVMLVAARTDTRWFHDYVYGKAAEIRFVKGRLKFGDGKDSAPFPSMVVVYRKNDTDVGR